jgi:hypothetical protein
VALHKKIIKKFIKEKKEKATPLATIGVAILAKGVARQKTKKIKIKNNWQDRFCHWGWPNHPCGLWEWFGHPNGKTEKKQNLEDLALEGGRTTPWPPQTGQGGGSATPFFFF